MLIWFTTPPHGLDLAQSALWPVLIGFVLAAVAGAIALPLLRSLKVRQNVYEDAPASHQVKSGTPTMGGIVFAVAVLPLALDLQVPMLGEFLILVLGCAAIGALDDLLGIYRGKNAGLKARTKLLLTAVIALLFLTRLDSSYAEFPRQTLLAVGTWHLTVPYLWWLLLGMLAVTGTIHAVNLTDGLDGLAAGSMIPPLAAFAALGFAHVLPQPTMVALLGLGACAAFLIYNRHPAKMFMGDTGSLALGALLAGVAIAEGEMLLLLLVGGIFAAEALSVIVQVGYFKATRGKRIFRMSPLHHHFELGGMNELEVTTRFWGISAVLSALGWWIAK